jgi:hypothetical protein
MQLLPFEIIDQILLYLSPQISLHLSRYALILRINPSCGMSWAMERGYLRYLKYLNERGSVQVYDQQVLYKVGFKGNLEIIR